MTAKFGFEAGLTAKGEIVDLTAEYHHTQGTLERLFTFQPNVDKFAVTRPYGRYISSSSVSGVGADVYHIIEANADWSGG